MESFIPYFGCGSKNLKGESTIDFICIKYEDLIEKKNIPYLNNHKVEGDKNKFYLTLSCINFKERLTENGVEKSLN